MNYLPNVICNLLTPLNIFENSLLFKNLKILVDF